MIKLKYKCRQFVTNYCCSIVNGICLGLAGKTQVLNRSTSVGDFVKIGEENASIEVELYHPEEVNITVLRQFNKAGKSSPAVQLLELGLTKFFVGNKIHGVSSKKLRNLRSQLKLSSERLWM